MGLYCSKAEVKAAVGKTGTDFDTVFDALIAAASAEIDRVTNRPDGYIALTTAAARLFNGSGKAAQYIDECVAITLVETRNPGDTTYTAWAATDWVAGRGDPFRRPDYNRLPYTWIMADPTGSYSHFPSGVYGLHGFRRDPDPITAVTPTVRVTAKWGYSVTVPTDIKQACLIQVSRMWKRGESAWADTTGSADMGVFMYRKELDPDIVTLLKGGRYIVPAVG